MHHMFDQLHATRCRCRPPSRSTHPPHLRPLLAVPLASALPSPLLPMLVFSLRSTLFPVLWPNLSGLANLLQLASKHLFSLHCASFSHHLWLSTLPMLLYAHLASPCEPPSLLLLFHGPLLHAQHG